MLITLKKVFLAVLLLLITVFALQNLATVDVHFLVWSVVLPRAVLVVALILIGMVIGWLLAQRPMPRL